MPGSPDGWNRRLSGGFPSPEQLLDWLAKNRPAEQLVLRDYSLPNLFAGQDRISGMVDLGLCGRFLSGLLPGAVF